MKRKRLTCIASALLISFFIITQLNAQQLSLPRTSPNQTITQTIGITDVTMKYSRPGVKGRIIWGVLVPYDKIWRTGANEATTITVSDTVMIAGNMLLPGTYGLATIPAKSDWTIIFNKKTDFSGESNYKKEEDAFRITVTPTMGDLQEWMRFSFENLTDNSADVVLAWEKIRVAFTIEVDSKAKTLAKARQVVGWNAPMQAASYCLQQNTNLDEAMKWINVSMMIQENYWNMRVKARLLAKAGKKTEAIALMEKAIAKGKEMKEPPFDFADMQKLLVEWKSI